MEHVSEASRIERDEMLIKRVGEVAAVARKSVGWEALFVSLDQFSGDFMAEREQPMTTDCREPL